MNIDQGVQVADLVGMFRRRGKLIVAVAGSVVLASYWVAMALPNSYSASALVLVEPQSVDESLVKAGVRESDLSQRLGIMTSQILSRARLSSIVEEFELYKDEWDDMTREEIIEKVRGHVGVTPVLSELEAGQRKKEIEEFSTFAISFVSESARIAAAVANRIADDFISEHIDERVNVSQKSLDFMRQSIQDLARQVGVADAEISAVKQQNVGRLPEDLDANFRIRERVMGEIAAAQRQLAAAQSDESFWKGQVLAAAAMEQSGNEASPFQRRRVLDLTLAELLSKGFTDKHPDVIQTRAELAVLDERIERSKEDEDGRLPDSYAEQNAHAEEKRAELRVKGAKSELQRLQGNLVTVEDAIADTPAVAEKLDGLARQHEQLSASYRDFSARLQEAGVQADMERRQLGEQLRILEPAFPPSVAASPNRVVLLVVGLILGVALGGAIALVAEGSDSSLHSPRQLQAATGIPVLASIPEIMFEVDRVARTRRLVREAVAAVVVVIFCLVGGILTYMLVNGRYSGVGREDRSRGADEEPDEAAVRSEWSIPLG